MMNALEIVGRIEMWPLDVDSIQEDGMIHPTPVDGTIIASPGRFSVCQPRLGEA
jgi:hypothetical protein